MAPRLAAAALLCLLVAGCAAAPAPVHEMPSAPVVAAPRSLDWQQSQCESITWFVPVLASSLEPYLPEGFQPAPVGPEAPAAVPAAAGGTAATATLGFRAVECGEGFGEADLLHSVPSGQLFTPVVPPAALREDRFTAHYSFGWDLMVASAPWRVGTSSWGMPVHDGGAFVGPVAEGWSGGLAMDRVGSFSVTGRTADGLRPVEGHSSRMVTTGAEGFALWDAKLTDVQVATGVGVWSVSPESWVADLLGETSGLATFELAQWNQPEGSIHWPGTSLGPTQGQEPPLVQPPALALD